MNTTIDIKPFQFRWSELVDQKSTQEETPFNFLVPKIETYYRSKAFVSQININPLIAASAPVFFLIEKIQTLYKAPDIDKLRDDLVHEIKAFEHQAQAHGYPSYIILAVRYTICLWVDQTILSKAWGQNVEWEKMQLAENQGSEQDNSFYLLLNRCLQEPAVYIDLLELFYLCLSLGFQGSNSTILDANNIRATQTRDCLFETISKQREGFSKRLEVSVGVVAPKNQPNFLNSRLMRSSIVILMTLFLISSYFMLNAHLEVPIKGIHAPLSFPDQQTG